MIATYQLMLTIGILAAFISDTLLAYGGHWRCMLGIVAGTGRNIPGRGVSAAA